MSVIEVRDLGKRYGNRDVLSGLDFCVEAGEVFAVLGPNGAGKTTTVEILEGHRRADAGHVRVLDHDPASTTSAFRARIGIMLQAAGLEEEVTPIELLAHGATYYPDPVAPAEMLALVGLDGPVITTRIGRLSGGERRRLDLALALIGRPELLFLDEPTAGFDPAARRVAWSLLGELRGRGVTIVLTTHSMEEAEALADRVAILVGGRILAQGSPRALDGSAATTVRFRLPDDVAGSAPPHALAVTARVEGRDLVMSTPDPTRLLHGLTEWALRRGVTLDGLQVAPASLEDIYLRLVGEGTSDG